MTPRSIAPLLLLAALWSGSPARAELAGERLSRVIDWRDGLPASYVLSVAQDRDGFIWIGTPGGVVRYVGRQARVVAPASHLIVGRKRLGTVFAYDSEKRLSTLSMSGASPIAGPDGGPITVTRGATIADDGTLWITRDGEILRLSSGGTWLPPVRAFEFVRSLAPGHEGGIFAYGRGKIVAINAAGDVGTVREVPGVMAAWARDDGATIVGINEPGVAGRIAILEQDGWREIFHRHARLIGFVMRDDTLWASYDTGLAAIHPSEPPEWMPLGSRFGGGGPLMVDDEGSLWLGSFRGLAHFPEPDTFAWSEGGPETPRYVSRDDRSVWLTTWGALVRFTPTTAGWTAYRLPQRHFQAACPGFDGRAFSTADQGLFSIDANGEQGFLDAPLANDNALCAVDASERLWMPSSRGLLLIEKPDRARLVFESAIDALIVDAADRLWFSSGHQICHVPADELASDRASPACEAASIEGAAFSLWTAPSGALWALHEKGIARRDPVTGAWSPVRGVGQLPTRWLSALAPSPAGGVWICGEGTLLRVVERLDRPEGWEIVERPGAWQGLPALSAVGVREDDDGTLWIGGPAGLVRMPPHARAARPSPPRVALLEALVDGENVAERTDLQLAYRRNRIELRFAALSYRDPTALRYRVRVHSNEAWSDPTAEPLFRFVDLAPGEYQIEVAASLDGQAWSASPARFAFRVDRPWWRSPWFFAVCVLLIAAAASLAIQLRAAHLVRLERQRTRIAMDLHDEIGSGLGSIGILAGVASRAAETQRAELIERIGTTARELSGALGDIVWALRPGSLNLAALFAQIEARAQPLFADGPHFEARVDPGAQAVATALPVQRSVLLIALEALHNAAKHAGATRVSITLSEAGRLWTLRVEDDGRGLPEPPASGARRGLGLEAMARRAKEIGATLAIDSEPHRGTRVTLHFRPKGRGPFA